jgi:hypothetical protein
VQGERRPARQVPEVTSGKTVAGEFYSGETLAALEGSKMVNFIISPTQFSSCIAFGYIGSPAFQHTDW